jgi:hypothetical protein
MPAGQYRHKDTRCTATQSLARHNTAAMNKFTSYAAMLVLLLAILRTARGALAAAGESYETMPSATGHKDLAAAFESSQEHNTRALLVVGGRNDPEVPCPFATQKLLCCQA